jgi:hypothetical protein
LGPTAAIAVTLLGVLGFYQFRVTGSPFTMPYQVYTETYEVVPVLRFQEFRAEPAYWHDVIRDFHLGFQRGQAEAQLGGLGVSESDIRGLAAFLLGRPLSAVAVLALLVGRGPRIWLIVVLLASGTVSHAITLVSPFRPHYFAPFVPLILFLVLRGLRLLSLWKVGGHRPARAIAGGILIATVGAFVVGAGLRSGLPPEQLDPFALARQRTASQLASEAGPQLVIVRYAPDHSVHREWVYNGADIDGAKTVWAREMGGEENQELLEYFSDRAAWLLEADTVPPRLTSYPQSTDR